MLGFPAVTLRDSIERPEALDAGVILMTGLDVRDVVENVGAAMADPNNGESGIPSGYEVHDTSRRAVTFILSTHRRHQQWAGLRLGSA